MLVLIVIACSDPVCFVSFVPPECRVALLFDFMHNQSTFNEEPRLDMNEYMLPVMVAEVSSAYVAAFFCFDVFV